MQVVSSIRFLARQGLALRGEGDESDSNLRQLLLLRAKDNPKIILFLETKKNKCTSPEIHNELTSLMGQQILRNIVSKLQFKYYTIMIDETTDTSNTEQVVIVLPWVDDVFMKNL